MLNLLLLFFIAAIAGCVHGLIRWRRGAPGRLLLAERKADRALWDADPDFARELGIDLSPPPAADSALARLVFEGPGMRERAAYFGCQSGPNPFMEQMRAAQQQGASRSAQTSLLGGIGGVLGAALGGPYGSALGGAVGSALRKNPLTEN